jgi:hypothetical protein
MLDVYNEREDPRVYGEIDLERRVVDAAQVRCLIPWKRCWDSRKSLFMKSCIRVTCGLSGPGDTIYTFYYFEPKRWTIRLLKK